jgi:hypothetical protein
MDALSILAHTQEDKLVKAKHQKNKFFTSKPL